MIAFVGFNLKGNDWKPARRVFLETIKERGIREDTVQTFGVFPRTIQELKSLDPSVVVCCGNAAVNLLLPDKPGDVEYIRGYVFDSPHGLTVLATVDPAEVSKTWVPWRMLFSKDIQKAKEMNKKGWERPLREVHIV